MTSPLKCSWHVTSSCFQTENITNPFEFLVSSAVRKIEKMNFYIFIAYSVIDLDNVIF